MFVWLLSIKTDTITKGQYSRYQAFTFSALNTMFLSKNPPGTQGVMDFMLPAAATVLYLE